VSRSSSRERAEKAFLYVLFCAGLSCAAVQACGGGSGDARPVASLAATTDATKAFAAIQKAWDAADGSAPGALRPKLEAFVATYPKDGRAALARAYLAFEHMDVGDWAAAERVLATLRAVQPGTTRDVVTIAEARMLRHDKQPDDALDALRPLVGKIVDATVRELFLEEITRAALDSRRDFEAVAYMDAWLRGVGEDKRERAEAKVEAELAKLPEPVLEQTYRAIRANRSVLGYGADTQRLIAERLAATAITRGDPTLARWLLDGDAGPSFVGGDAGALLGEIATSKRGLTSFAGRTIGLLLPTASVDLRDEAADVARGVAWALGLPRMDPNGGDGVHLVTRDDGGDPTRTESALEELAGEGAGIVIAALDAKTAERALAWGEAHQIAVVALSAPDLPHAGDWGFVLGQSRDEELSAIADVLAARGIAKAAVVGSAPTPILEGRGFPLFLPLVSCDLEAQQAGEPRFPLASWAKQGAHVVVVAGPVECARDVIRELGVSGKPATVVLTLDDGSTTARAAGVSLLGVTAGVVPVVAARAAEVGEPDVRAYMTQFGARPSWWTALGRDAGTLARAAIAPLPLDTTADRAVIAQRRSLVQFRVATATAQLWTTEATGFAGAHTIKRKVRVTDLPSK
jgi:hypothetical protein